MDILLIEYGVMSYPDPRLEGWRFFRIEYGGHAQDCFMERHLWLPPGFDVNKFEDDLREAAKAHDEKK